ncbi:hypothetical protein A2U01_0114467 [Trifolium medium]|uniref:Uncharacterized protein n=1 Tax=Trifolium medium TaxID=97028 RepID=A0A392W088_9FABA|nr:hypothetical protein [Trifolium medium]
MFGSSFLGWEMCGSGLSSFASIFQGSTKVIEGRRRRRLSRSRAGLRKHDVNHIGHIGLSRRR